MNKSKNSFLKQLVKEIGDDYTNIAAEGTSSAEFSGFIDTGSFIFNAALSGSLFGGMPSNKILCLAGPQAVGKTFFALGIVKHFLASNPENFVFWYMSEPAVTKKMLEDREIDPERVVFAEPSTIQEFRTQCIATIDNYMEKDTKDRPQMMMVLDSLGALSTTKEITDTTAGKDTRDMTRAQLIRGAFRVIALKLARANIPMIFTNHTYSGIGPFAIQNELSGGGGIKYAADQIAILTKRKEKVGKEVIGNIIHVTMFKNRIAKENTRTDVLLSYDQGLDQYYGLRDLAVSVGLIEKMAKGYAVKGARVSTKELQNNPQNYFDEEMILKLEEAAHAEFEYGKKGSGFAAENEEEEEAVA